MKLYRIIPLERKIEAIEYNGQYEEMHPLLTYDCLDHARLNKAGDKLFINDEGLLDGTKDKDGSFYWQYQNGQWQEFIGIALLWGTRGEDNANPSLTIPQVYANISWDKPMGAQEAKPDMQFVSFDTTEEMLAYLEESKAPWQ